MLLEVFLSLLIILIVVVGGVAITAIISGIVYRVFRELFKNLL